MGTIQNENEDGWEPALIEKDAYYRKAKKSPSKDVWDPVEIDLEEYLNEKQSQNTSEPPKESIQNPSDDEDDIVGIDMREYSKSKEKDATTWWDLGRDILLQPSRGVAQAFTWPLDIVKAVMTGEALTDMDELEAAYDKAGKKFDRAEYEKTVREQADYIPTQEMFENFIEKQGLDLNPKTKIGKAINQMFMLIGVAKGKGLGKATLGGAAGAATTAGLEELGANETASRIIGDVVGGAVPSIKKTPRILDAAAQRLQDISAKHGLPFYEHMTEKAIPKSPKINESRRVALENELGMSIDSAVDAVVEGNMPSALKKAQGADLQVLEDAALIRAEQAAQQNNVPIGMNQVGRDIDLEIARIKAQSPSPSNSDKVAIKILEDEKAMLNPAQSAADPTTEQLITQTRKYNENVKGVYKKPEFTGSEEAATRAYAFLNESIRNTLEAQTTPEVVAAHRAYNELFGQNAALKKVEGLLSKASVDGNYDPKKINKLLNSSQGQMVKRELGKQGVEDLREIAQYGERAKKGTEQFAKSGRGSLNLGAWGQLAPIILSKAPGKKAFFAVKPIRDWTQGYLLTNPATRTTYKNILKNAAQGSFKNMAADFSKLEKTIEKSFGSVEEFFKSAQSQLEIWDGED
jgi:hypothetical protein